MAPSGKWIDGIGPDTPVEEAARRSLAARLSAVSHWLPLAAYLPEQDIEHVHRLRVTTRRAVAALELYRDWLPRKRARRLAKRLRKIRRAAGEARDLDVLGQRLARDYGERRAAPVAALIDERRAAVQPKLVRIAERCRRRDRFARRTAGLVRRIRPPKGHAPCATRLANWAAERLAATSDAFLAAMVIESADPASLHQFRIRAKALRYTIELVAPAFGPELRSDVYPVVEKLQERLGRIQDHAAATEQLCDMAGETTDAELQESLQSLAAEESGRLDDERRAFYEWWTHERAEALRQALAEAANLTQPPRSNEIILPDGGRK